MKKSLSKKLQEKMNVAKPAPHVVVEALAGTGKTFTLIMGVGWAFAQDRWDEIQLRFAEDKDIKHAAKFCIEPSPEQQQVWEAMAQSENTKTIVYSAFNKSIVREFEQDWSWLVEILAEEGITLQFATVNSLGHRATCNALSIHKVCAWRTENLLAEELGYDSTWKMKREHPVLTKAVCAIIDLCKLTLAGWVESAGFNTNWITAGELDRICSHYEIELNGLRDRIYELVPQILQASAEPTTEIDFNDQNWLPIILDLPVPRVDLLLIDESQDLCRCKQEFSRKLGRRIILVGDKNQAIYGFAGADTESIPRMKQLLSPTDKEPLPSLYLTETRRCGKAIVAEAQRIVPEYQAHATNCEGTITHSTMDKYIDLIEDGDMALCRINAPLVSQVLRLLKDGRKAIIRGRDFGSQLVKFVERANTSLTSSLLEWLDNWAQTEEDKEYRQRNPNEARLIAIQDRRDCILAFCEDARTVEKVIGRINLVFAGKICPICNFRHTEEKIECPKCKIPLTMPEGIIFSSIHRAKGMEASRIFLLEPPGATIPHPLAKTRWQLQQERNCRYIAITRGVKELVYVS